MATCYQPPNHDLTNGNAGDGTATKMQHSVKVVYAQTIFIYICGGVNNSDKKCGTFLEIHLRNSMPYDVIAMPIYVIQL